MTHCNETDRAVLILRGYCPECFAPPDTKHPITCSVGMKELRERTDKLLKMIGNLNDQKDKKHG